MNLYMFVFVAKPCSHNEYSKTLKSAYVHIWVFSESIESAESRAKEYINSYSWNPESLEHAFEILPSMIPQLGAAESRLYRLACQNGISADFVASPLNDGSPDDPIRILPLESK